MRCTLLSEINYQEFLSGCTRLEPEQNIDALRKVAIVNGDRHSLSILFRQIIIHSGHNASGSELHQYAKVGKLFPVTTKGYTTGAYIQGRGLDGWPLGHLLSFNALVFKRCQRKSGYQGGSAVMPLPTRMWTPSAMMGFTRNLQDCPLN